MKDLAELVKDSLTTSNFEFFTAFKQLFKESEEYKHSLK